MLYEKIFFQGIQLEAENPKTLWYIDSEWTNFWKYWKVNHYCLIFLQKLKINKNANLKKEMELAF